MHKIQINDDIYQLPGSWDELTCDELLYLAKLTREDISLEKVKIHMLLYCLKAHVSRHRKRYNNLVCIVIGKSKPIKYLFTPEEVYTLANVFSFLFEVEKDSNEQTIRYYIKPERFVNPYPTIHITAKKKFTGPDDGLYDITFEQFIYMQTYLDAMQRDPHKINPLLACLWHSEKAFDINRLDIDSAQLLHLPENQKIVMYWFITGCLMNLGNQFPRVFSGKAGNVKNNVFDAQLRLLDTLAGSDVTKKDAVRKGNLIDALYTMDESVRKQDELEERLQNKR